MVASAEYHAEYNASRQQEKTTTAGDVYLAFRDAFDRGPLDWERRRAAAGSLALFCRTYGGPTFSLAWSPAHLRAIERIEAAVLNGDQFALAMPRGSGKTSLCRWAVIWAIANGHSPYAVLVGATDKAATKQLKLLKSNLRFNDTLFDDYPELCGPVRHLRGEPRKATSQHFRGTPTGIVWGKDQIVLAHVPLDYATCSEAIIDVAGITGDVRGRQYERRDGSTVRPTVAVVDDPQTRKSARSSPDTEARIDTINGDVKFLAGPEHPVGVVVPCTVIRGGDLAEQLLDREKNPEWHGFRTRFFESMPSDAALKLWEGEYAKLRRRALREDREPVEATEFYVANRAAMDDGCEPSWPERFYGEKGEVSAVQRGMNEYLRDRGAFLAEYQNDPEQTDEVSAIPMLDEKALAAKVSGMKRGVGIAAASRVVAMVDVHDNLLYWAVAAVRDDFTGGLIDAGVYPKQPTRDFTLRSAKRTLQDVHPGSGEAAITAGVLDLTSQLCERNWMTADGQALPLSLCLVDTGYKPEQVARACLSSPHKAVLMGSRGVGIGPDGKPMTEYDMGADKVRRCGPDRESPRWYVPKTAPYGLQIVRFDKYFWQSSIHARFVTQAGESGEWTLWGDEDADHRELARHILSQEPIEMSARGRSVHVWKLRPAREDHWLDTSIGCLVAASVLGCRLAGQVPVVKPTRKRVKLSELRAQRKAGR